MRTSLVGFGVGMFVHLPVSRFSTQTPLLSNRLPRHGDFSAGQRHQFLIEAPHYKPKLAWLHQAGRAATPLGTKVEAKGECLYRL